MADGGLVPDEIVIEIINKTKSLAYDFLFDRNNFLRENICIWSEEDMYEIEVCYKIIFEAMLEKPVLKSIAEKINEYTGAKVIFVSGAEKSWHIRIPVNRMAANPSDGSM